MSDYNCTPKALFNKENVNILLCEEDSAIRAVCGIMLGEYRASYMIVGDGETALAEALTGQYDIFIFDPKMESCDGFQLAKKLSDISKENEKTLFLLAHNSNMSELGWASCKNVGFHSFLTKPLSIEALDEFIEKTQIMEV